jgi:hypothetical protein
LICFDASSVDVAAVSETEAKRKNAVRWLDRDPGVWDIEITRHTLIESRAEPSDTESALQEASRGHHQPAQPEGPKCADSKDPT